MGRRGARAHQPRGGWPVLPIQARQHAQQLGVTSARDSLGAVDLELEDDVTFGLIVAAMVLAGVKLAQSRGADILAWAVLAMGAALSYTF